MHYQIIIFILAIVCFASAVLLLVKDARQGFMFQSGGEDWFKLLWFVGSVLVAILLMQRLQWPEISLVPSTIVVGVNALWVDKLIRKVFLGKGLKNPNK